MPTLTCPKRPEEITEAWLTDALNTSGMLNTEAISSFDLTVLGEGKGFTGQVARIEIQYTHNNRSLPDSLIAKFPPAAPEMFDVLSKYGIYEREAGFYTTVSQEVSLTVPKLYYSHVDMDAAESVLLLEDFPDAEPLDIFTGLPIEETLFIVEQLAAFHAGWWQSPRLKTFDWLWMFNQDSEKYQAEYAEQFQTFKQKMGDLVSPEFITLGERVKDNVVWIRKALVEEPTTFLHGDFHLNNMFLNKGTNGYELKVFDWQICCRGNAMRDLMYITTSALTTEMRRKYEMNVMRTYYKKLVSCGVTQYTFEECLHAFKLAVLDLYYFMTTVLVILDFTVNEEAVAVRDLILERWGTFIMDHYPIDLLPEA